MRLLALHLPFGWTSRGLFNPTTAKHFLVAWKRFDHDEKGINCLFETVCERFFLLGWQLYQTCEKFVGEL